MGSISHHIMPLVINGLGGRDAYTHAYRHSWTETILRNQARDGLLTFIMVVIATGCKYFNFLNLEASTHFGSIAVMDTIVKNCKCFF